MSNANLRVSVGLDDVLDCPSADWAARVGHLLELQATGVAKTHVTTGIKYSVHHVLAADGAVLTPRARTGWEGRGE